MSDPYFNSVVALLHFNGADGSTTFTDVKGHTFTPAADAQLDTSQVKWGTASGFFDGTGDYISTPDHNDFEFGADAFTIEFWVRFNTVTGSHAIINKGASGSPNLGPFHIDQNGTAIRFFSSSNGTSWDIASARALGTIATGQWYHVAVCRNGSTWHGFLNGTQQSGFPFTSSATVVDNSLAVFVGALNDGTSGFNGWIDDLRITKGVARYIANFTPPGAEFPDVLGDPIGEAVLTAPVKTLSTAGTVGEVGTGSGTMPSKIYTDGACLGLTGEAGTVSESLPAKTLQGTSLSDAAGVGSMELVAKLLSADGLTGTAGVASLTLPALLLDGGESGAQLELPMKLLAAAGYEISVGVANNSMPAKVLLGAGIVETLQEGSSTLPAKLLSATGLSENQGAAGLELPALLLSAEGFSGAVGSADLALPLKALLGTGYFPTEGTAQLVLPALQLSASGFATVAATYRVWALNTRTRALSEYKNLEFNSFAVVNGVVLGATADGIFILGLQSQDDDAAISANVRDGAMEYGSSHLKRLPRIYVGLESDGDVLFDTITTEHGTRTYLLPENGTGLRSRRVPVGKGPKSRYWTWGVRNQNGADFTLSSVALYPKALNRRVQ